MKKLMDLVGQFAGRKIAVLGDLVIDQYVFATPKRISREAPVLIVCEEGRQIRLGSAGNVVANIRSMGGVPLPVGLVGDDRMGKQLLELMVNQGIDTQGILMDASRLTTTKTRVLAGGRNTVRQQMLRMDRLNKEPVTTSLRRLLVERLKRVVLAADALVVSDYAEGVVEAEVFEEVLGITKRKKLPVFVDSRYRIQEFQAVDTLIPNEPELADASKLDVTTQEGLEKAGRWLLEKTGSKAALVKRGRSGMALFLPDRPTVQLAAFGLDEVADRIGAGDTVLAAYALAQSAGAGPEEAMQVANTAGGITVTKSGTALVDAAELMRALESGS